MFNTTYECSKTSTGSTVSIRVPLMKLQMPRLKPAIHKKKDWVDPGFDKKKFCLALKKGTEEKTGFGTTIPMLKKQLSIRIPNDNEVKALTPGSRVKSVSNYADTNEAGMFYGVTLKKGAYRRSNEDRVCNGL